MGIGTPGNPIGNFGNQKLNIFNTAKTGSKSFGPTATSSQIRIFNRGDNGLDWNKFDSVKNILFTGEAGVWTGSAITNATILQLRALYRLESGSSAGEEIVLFTAYKQTTTLGDCKQYRAEESQVIPTIHEDGFDRLYTLDVIVGPTGAGCAGKFANFDYYWFE